MLPLDLGDGLILRCARLEDGEALIAFNAYIHPEDGTETPNESVGVWARDLLKGNHPTFHVEDFTIVEDTRSGAIVSSLNLIDQTWSYGGIPFGVGRPELVGTLADYRKRGLVRTQFDLIHRWSAERGHLVQVIGGIPYYYRQFGYEMALPMASAQMGYFPQNLPKLKEGDSERWQFRPATEADVPLIKELYDKMTRREPVACVWDDAICRYEVNGRDPKSFEYRAWQIIESADGEAVGCLAHKGQLSRSMIAMLAYELKPGVPWVEVTPAVVRYLEATGRHYAERDQQELAGFMVACGFDHPAFEILYDQLPRKRDPYAWYIRIADVPGFIRHITPALEQRLANSAMLGYSGEVKISFYRDGTRLIFEKGFLKTAEAWIPSTSEPGSAAFPSLTFLQLLMGYHTVEELQSIFPDCWVEGLTRPLLKALFPKQWSNVWSLA